MKIKQYDFPNANSEKLFDKENKDKVMKKDSLKDTIQDTLDKFTTTASRAAQTTIRANKLLEAGVSVDTVATQLSANSSNGFKYTDDHVRGFDQLTKDCRTKVGLTKRQTTALIRDQEESDKN